MSYAFDGFISCTPLLNRLSGIVVAGSLDAAMSGRALTREEYVISKRSNIKNDSEEGKRKRHDIYDVFDKYRKWKQGSSTHDVNDVVLELIKSKRLKFSDGNWIQLFNA